MNVRSIALLLPLAVACTDTTGPDSTETITLGPCLVGSYFAYRNQGADWVELPLAARTSATIEVTSRTAIAFGPSAANTAIFATAGELKSVDCDETPFIQPKAIDATLANVGDDELFAIAAGGRHNLLLPPYSDAFTFFSDSMGAVDIVATLSAPANTFNTSATEKVIVRRSVASPESGIPALDFASAEAMAPGATTIAGDPLAQGEQASVDVGLLTAGGTRTILPMPWPAAAPFTIPVLPASLSNAGDTYRLQYAAFTSDASRHALDYFGPAATHTAQLGPALATPVWTSASGAASPRLPRQDAYPNLASITYHGAQGRTATIIVTAGYQADLSDWDLGWPEPMTPDGFDTWEVAASDQPLAVLLGREEWTRDARYRWATRSGTVVSPGFATSALPK
jgi:hypothetical protein